MTLWFMLQHNPRFWFALGNLILGLTIGTTVTVLVLRRFLQFTPPNLPIKIVSYIGFTLFFTLMVLGSYVTPALTVAIQVRKAQHKLFQTQLVIEKNMREGDNSSRFLESRQNDVARRNDKCYPLGNKREL